MRQTVFGIFDKPSDAQNAVKNLLDEGFSREVIDVRSNSERKASSGTTEHKSKSNERNSDGYRNFFSNLFANDDEATTYSEVASRGSVVTVHTATPEESERAAQVLDRFGAVDANERISNYRTEGAAGRSTATGSDSIPVIEENMEVGKREVETGGVRVRSRIVERPVEEHLRLREEHVEVERNRVDRPATEEDFRNFKEGETEITEHAEVPVINKEARVKEEINLNKETRDRDRTVRDNVRKTEVDVEKTRRDEDIDRR